MILKISIVIQVDGYHLWPSTLPHSSSRWGLTMIFVMQYALSKPMGVFLITLFSNIWCFSTRNWRRNINGKTMCAWYAYYAFIYRWLHWTTYRLNAMIKTCRRIVSSLWRTKISSTFSDKFIGWPIHNQNKDRNNKIESMNYKCCSALVND